MARHKNIDVNRIHRSWHMKSALKLLLQIARNIIQAQYKCRAHKPTDKIIASDKIIAKTHSKAQNF